jgi:DoxX-like family
VSLATQDPPISKASLWAGRILTALVVLFMLFDACVKLLKLAPAVEGTIKLGYPVSVVFPLGLVLLACTMLYTIPRTAILGAILLTGYLGGAVATQVRVQSASFWFAVLFGVLVWLGLYLRDSQLRALIPLRRS